MVSTWMLDTDRKYHISYILVPYKGSFVFMEKKIRGFHVRRLKMVWSVQKSVLEKNVRMDVCSFSLQVQLNSSFVPNSF